MKSAIILVLCSLAVSASVSHEDAITGEWEQFKAEYGKTYATKEEESFRKKVFLDNREHIVQHNSRAANGLESFTLGMNEYGDIPHDEFVRMMNGFKNDSLQEAALSSEPSMDLPLNTTAPRWVDWRRRGYVTPVKRQGKCDSHWAFSATGALEGQHFRRTGRLVSLSEQNLIDCSSEYGNNGCNGGSVVNAFRYIRDNNGIDTEESYPYREEEGRCRFSNSHVGATVRGFVTMRPGSEERLTNYIANYGPISVTIDGSQRSFQFYNRGVYYESSCSSSDFNHAVLAVGYGTDAGRDYYIVKNSWGKSWGMSGYIYMSRNRNNNCGIAGLASYPLV